ncbi:heterokaryon incompatibility protein-domain-containing protein [Cubamyces lactineus]|nr:heterokaryon incompatibility protein-domain-containing protein [Cubamyces lactineus]
MTSARSAGTESLPQDSASGTYQWSNEWTGGGGDQYFILQDGLLICKDWNCMWYRCLERDVFGAMSAWFEDRTDNRTHIPNEESESNVLRTFKISTGADNPAASWITYWSGMLHVNNSDVWDLEKAWFINCVHQHKSCRDFDDWARPQRSLPILLIDCSDPHYPRLVMTEGWDPHVRYATLSYVWGGEQPNHTTKENISSYQKVMRVSQPPKTTVDAIQVAHALGIQYLWVDSLCIIQDSREDKHRELTKMRSVYHHAFLSIDGVSAAGASQGFLHSDRTPVQASIWLPFSSSRRHQGKARQFTELLGADSEADFIERSSGSTATVVKEAHGETGDRAWCL